jgi:hypothetical protein
LKFNQLLLSIIRIFHELISSFLVTALVAVRELVEGVPDTVRALPKVLPSHN